MVSYLKGSWISDHCKCCPLLYLFIKASKRAENINLLHPDLSFPFFLVVEANLATGFIYLVVRLIKDVVTHEKQGEVL